VCEGILGLAKKFGADRLANACRNAQSFHTESKLYTSIRSMLENNMENQRENLFDKVLPMPNHDNIRGEDYYK